MYLEAGAYQEFYSYLDIGATKVIRTLGLFGSLTGMQLFKDFPSCKYLDRRFSLFL